MSSGEAQKSPVHHATEDSNVEPSGPAAPSSQGNQDGRDGNDRSGAVVQQAADLKLRPDGAPGDPGNIDAQGDLKIRNDPDESTFGGPLNLDDPDAV